MKILFLIFTLLISLNAAKIDNFAKSASYYRDYNLALANAQKQHKILMLVLVADFCPWCKKFERKSLEDSSIDKLVKENFIPIIVDSYRDKQKYPKKYFTKKLPTVYFIDSNTKKVLNKSELYVKKSHFRTAIEETISRYKESKK